MIFGIFWSKILTFGSNFDLKWKFCQKTTILVKNVKKLNRCQFFLVQITCTENGMIRNFFSQNFDFLLSLAAFYYYFEQELVRFYFSKNSSLF